MRRPRGPAQLALALVALALAVGVVAALVVTRDGDQNAAPTTGQWAPISVKRPELPVIGGGLPVDLDPRVRRNDLTSTLSILPGERRYRITVSNVSSLGAINSFQWYPPRGVQIVEVIGSSEGNCAAAGRTGFGGHQFPTLILYPNILCDGLDMKVPSCTCLVDGGAVSISFVTDKELGGGGDLRVRNATLSFDKVPTYINSEGVPE